MLGHKKKLDFGDIQFAKVLAFYPGITLNDLETMSAQKFNKLWGAIDVLESQSQMMLIKAFQFKDLEPAARKENWNNLVKLAYPRDIYKQKTKAGAPQKTGFMFAKVGVKNGRRK